MRQAVKISSYCCPQCGTLLAEYSPQELQRMERDDDDDSTPLHCLICRISLVVHHPVYGIKHRAGDSWSVSYVK